MPIKSDDSSEQMTIKLTVYNEQSPETYILREEIDSIRMYHNDMHGL